MVSRLVRVQEAWGSNPHTPTIPSVPTVSDDAVRTLGFDILTVQGEETLHAEQIEDLNEFVDALISAENVAHLDLSIASLIEDRLSTDADQKSNLYDQIRRMDTQI